MTQQDLLDILSLIPKDSIFLPDMQNINPNMFIIGNTRDISKNWFAFFNNESYRQIFEKEFVEMLTSGEEVHT